MLITKLKAKLHAAHVTEAELEYDGSITIDRDLMDYVKISEYEKVLVANMANGERFETYVIEGERGSGVICLNGATAHKGSVGDRVIIFTFAQIAVEDADTHKPLIVKLDENNRPVGGLKEA